MANVYGTKKDVPHIASNLQGALKRAKTCMAPGQPPN